MQTKGLELSDDPNLILNIVVVVRQEQQIKEPDDRKYMGQRLNNREEPEVVLYDVGDVIIDFVDNHENTLIWQASIETVLSKKEDKMKKKIEKSVVKIFEEFPHK